MEKLRALISVDDSYGLGKSSSSSSVPRYPSDGNVIDYATGDGVPAGREHVLWGVTNVRELAAL